MLFISSSVNIYSGKYVYSCSHFQVLGTLAKAGLLHAAMQPDQESESACTRWPGHWRAHGHDGPHPGLGQPC